MLGLGVVAAGIGTAAVFRNELVRSALLARNNEGTLASAAQLPYEDSCILTPVQDEGPFFLPAPERADIREDRHGIPLQLDLRLVAGDGCSAFSDALVEIWHCDARGDYSSYPPGISRKPFETLKLLATESRDGHVPPSNDTAFLRGSQRTGSDGLVRFQTIFPGWYDPRIPHIHVKVFAEGEGVLTTQLYFPMDYCNAIYSSHPRYKDFGTCPYTMRNDMVLGGFPDARGLVLQPEGDWDDLVAGAQLVLPA